MQVQQKGIAGVQERRFHPRFMAPERALVALTGDYLGLPYNMTDISEGGLAFMYIGEMPLPLTDKQMDIYINEDLQIGRMPVTVVADQQMEGYFIPQRRCSLRFGNLTETQREQLQVFINRHALVRSQGA